MVNKSSCALKQERKKWNLSFYQPLFTLHENKGDALLPMATSPAGSRSAEGGWNACTKNQQSTYIVHLAKQWNTYMENRLLSARKKIKHVEESRKRSLSHSVILNPQQTNIPKNKRLTVSNMTNQSSGLLYCVDLARLGSCRTLLLKNLQKSGWAKQEKQNIPEQSSEPSMHLDKPQATSAHVCEAVQVLTQLQTIISWSCLIHILIILGKSSNQLKCAKSDDHVRNVG